MIHKFSPLAPNKGVNAERLPTVPTAASATRVATLPEFQEIFESSTPFAWRVLARMGVASGDLPDVCQDVFVIVYRKLSEYDGRASLRSWIYGICIRTASEYRRRQRVRPEQLQPELPEVAVPAPQDHDLESKRARAHLQNALDHLDENKRAVFVLYEIEELSMSEIADALEIPVQTAYSRLHAARKAITAAFRQFKEVG